MASETVVQQRTRLEHARFGPLFRNNVGACTDDTGRLVRYGLANESKQMNEQIKSADLIGITPVQAYVEHLGGWTVLGVFTAYETKHPGWHQTPGDKRAGAQARFHGIVRDAGGFAGFVTDPADIYRIMRRG